MLAAFRTTIPARSCGDDTNNTPLIGKDCITVKGASDVPGGKSIIKKSIFPQSVSVQNCLIALPIKGPRQITASSSC